MLDSKFFLTLIGMVIAVIAVSNTSFSSPVNENFDGMPSRSTRVVREIYPAGLNNPQLAYTAPPDYNMLSKDISFIQRPSITPPLPPRFSNTQYGARILYNKPAYENLAVPSDPLAFADMAKNEYGMPKAGNGDFTKPKKVNTDAEYFEQQDTLPMSDMSQTIGSDGTAQNPIVYERHIYANQKSRLRTRGDPIRGDIAVVPIKYGNFDVHPTPHIDLHTGAMNVMGGFDNSTSKALSSLFAVSSGSSTKGNQVGGIDVSREYNITGSGSMGNDLQVTSFM